jgi:hypothetical protein
MPARQYRQILLGCIERDYRPRFARLQIRM